MKILLVVLSTLLLSNAYSQIKNLQTENIKINGNCGMCQTTIEKAGSKTKISNVNWNEESKIATIKFDNKKTNLDDILKNIALAGYDNPKYIAPNNIYEKLPGCCKYERTLKPNASITDLNPPKISNVIKTDTTKPKPKSPRLVTNGQIGANSITIDYGSPSVRGRSIWNGLVAYNQVWATGAHSATSIEFTNDVIINGKTITKGKYGFFTIPNATEWVLILNKNWNMHLADDYNQQDDIIRMHVTPQKNPNIVEALTYEVISEGTKGEIKMSWEMLNVSFKFSNQ